MKRSRLLPAFLLALATFWGCSSNDAPSPTSPDTIEENQLKGSISGTVTDSVKHGISGVAVTLDSGGFATNTDSLGRYTIPNVPGRTWTVRFTKANWHDTAVSGVKLAIDEDRLGVDMRMRYTPDTAILVYIDRDVAGLGMFTGKTPGAILDYDSFQISSVQAIATITRQKGDTQIVRNLSWYGQTYTGKLPIMGKSGTLKIQLRNAGNFVSADTTILFHAADTGLLSIAGFHAGNNLPYVSLADVNTTAGTTVTLRALAGDRKKRPITRYEWSVNGQPFSIGNSDTIIAIPADAKTSFSVIVRVTNSDGIPAQDTAFLRLSPGVVDPRDGQTYPVVTIGKQTWMAKNLNYKTDSSWWYENNADSGAKYGRLYTWASSMDLPDSCNLERNLEICTELIKPVHQGACPVGWHVPTPDEWTYLTDTVQNSDSSATRLRANRNWFVAQPSWTGTDQFSFAALPGGFGFNGNFSSSGVLAYFRTTSPDNVPMLQPYLTAVQHNVANALIGYSLRCLKD
ncbi:MAG: hypothetical protein RL318_1736 [Fibrobacterota bacterium]|jgi:uncharacterized protein (TIGR02145 family)